MKKLLYILFAVIVVLSACSGANSNKTEDADGNSEPAILSLPYSIHLEKILSEVKPVNLSEIAKEIRYAPLETSANCLLKRVHEFAFTGNTFLVSDFANLYQYDSQGKFIKKVGQKGTGPRDYVYINSILNDDVRGISNVFTSGKVNVYDKDMNYLKSWRLLERYYGGLATPWGSYLMYLSSSFKLVGDTATVYSFAEIDTSGHVIRKIPNPSPIISTYHGMIYAPIPFYKHKDVVRYMDYGNDTLFTLSKGGDRSPYVVCSLGSMKREVDTHGFNPKQMEALASKVLVQNICEDERYLYLTLRWGVTDKVQYVLYSKRTGEIRNVGTEGLQNDIDGGVPFFPQFIKEDGTMVMYVEAEDFIKNAPSGNALASGLRPDDNPVFVMVK